MVNKQALTVLLVAVAIWAVLTFVTRTWDPLGQVQRLLSAGVEITNMKLTHADQDDAGNCLDTPDNLAAAASEVLGSPVTVEEYALARMCANEALSDLKGGTDDDKNARIWVAINDANQNNGGDILQAITNGRGFGPQSGGRKYSTGHPRNSISGIAGNDPTDYHLSLVRNCLSGTTPDPTGGSTHFMDKYGFATPDHRWDSARYDEVVAQWQGYGWTRVLTIGKGLEIWRS